VHWIQQTWYVDFQLTNGFWKMEWNWYIVNILIDGFHRKSQYLLIWKIQFKIIRMHSKRTGIIRKQRKIHSRGRCISSILGSITFEFLNAVQHKIDEIHLPREWISRCSRIIPVLLEWILTILNWIFNLWGYCDIRWNPSNKIFTV
jgi:hypothetical protein